MDHDEVARALAHPRRRKVIRYFQDLDAEWIPAERLNREVFDGDDRLLADLHHFHLPVLDDAGLIEYDGQTKTIRLAEQPEYVDEILSILETADA